MSCRAPLGIPQAVIPEPIFFSGLRRTLTLRRRLVVKWRR